MLTVVDGLLLKDTRLVVPARMRNDVLAKLHEGHQGVEKCKSRARQVCVVAWSQSANKRHGAELQSMHTRATESQGASHAIRVP